VDLYNKFAVSQIPPLGGRNAFPLGQNWEALINGVAMLIYAEASVRNLDSGLLCAVTACSYVAARQWHASWFENCKDENSSN
jgi:hypothetical protein